MTRISVLAGVLASVIALGATTVSAQPNNRLCAERASLIAQLESRHGETRQSVGLQEGRAVIETFANPETGSWTIIASLPDGVSCLVAVGESWRAEDPASSDDAA